MITEITIGNKKIGIGHPTYIIAEIGTNHHRDKKIAKKIIDEAAEAGVDAVKFQIYHSTDIVNKGILAKEYNWEKYNKKYVYEIFENFLRTPREWFPELSKYARKKGLDVIATPHCQDCANFIVKTMKVSAIKVASMCLTNLPLLKIISEYKLPIILSTGMGDIKEINQAVKTIKRQGNNQIILLHCISDYPSSYEQMNLRNIVMLRDKFNLSIGFSDHSKDNISAVIAASLGSCMIEKHITLNRTNDGPDNHFALEPKDLTDLVKKIRITEKVLGNYNRVINSHILKTREKYRKSLISTRKIKKGEIITQENTTITRPGTGIAPGKVAKIYNIKKAKKDIERWKPIKEDYIE